jgi:parallel beta-helix repeat protein
VYYSTTPLDGVTVELLQGTPQTYPPLQSTTTSSGFYSFSSVDPGSYWIKIYGPTDEYPAWIAHSIEVVSSDITKDMDLPKKITLLSPENNAFITSRNPTLSWEANSEAARYTIQIDVTEGWQLVEFVENITSTYYTVQTELTPGNYRWGVGAYDAYNHNVGTAQPTFRFTVLRATIYVYVDASNTSGIEDGSQEYPFNTIMEGINAAYDGDTVLVAAGTYYENVVMKEGVDLIGVGASLVTIDAGGTGNVIEGADRCTINGFTITNSGADHSYSGIDCPDFCTMLITNNIVTSCTNGIYCRQSSSIISNNVISTNGNTGNATTDFAICCNNSSLTISNNLILDNLEVAIYTCWSRSDSALILNNTIANNINDDAVWCYESSPTIKNNIIVGNYRGIVAIYSSFPEISYNNVWNNTGEDYNAQTGSICKPGTGDISANPMFVDAANGDYYLSDFSPCISAGIMTLDVPNTDIEGNPRPDPPDSSPDMGAYENPLAVKRYSLTIAAGTGGATNPSPGTYTYNSGTEVNITAIPNSGYAFSEWSGETSRNENPITITMDKDKSITANFILSYQLKITSGNGGTTDPSPGTYTYNSGTEVNVTAFPEEGHEFSEWSGDASGSENPITITVDQDKWIIAIFTSPDEEDESGSWELNCFIATAAYDSPFHSHVEILRNFRDKYLITNKFGRKLVKLYYKYSPPLANIIAKHKTLKIAVRIHLLPFVAFSYSMNHLGPIITSVILVFIFMLPLIFIAFWRKKIIKRLKNHDS